MLWLRRMPREGRVRNSQSLGYGTGFKLHTLCIEKTIRGLQSADLRLNFSHLAGDQGSALCAIDGITPFGGEDFADCREGKTHALGILNKTQIDNRLIAVAAVVVGLPLGHDKPEFFVIAQCMAANSTSALQLSNVHSKFP